MDPIEGVIIDEYVKFDVPADRIAADPAVGGQFADKVNPRLPAKLRLSVAELNKKTLNMRKSGKLPKLRNGHGPNSRA